MVARVPFSGFAGDAAGQATYEEFAACLADHGVDLPAPSAGGTPATVAEPSSPDVLREAWGSCRDVFAGYLRSSAQSGPEFVDSQVAELDCVAAAGFYPPLAQPVADPAAVDAAYDSCAEETPGRAALVECLARAGVQVIVDGRTTSGPFPGDRAAAAWSDCRDTFVTWSIPNQMFVSDRLPPLDCAAEHGWIVAVAGLAERARPEVRSVIDSSATG